MALTKVITGVTDLNQAQSTNGLKFPTGNEFAGTPEEGMIRNDQSQASEGSASTMQFYNGTAWKNFVNISPVPLATDNFNTVLYTGDGTTGRSITTGLAADLVIIKNRSSALQDWIWFDSTRGASEYIRSNSTSQEYNAGSGQGVSAFGSTTVTIGDNAAGNLGANGSVG